MSSSNGNGLAYFAIVPEFVIDAPISDRAVRLYARLARFADKDGFCRPPRKLLAEKLRCSVKSIDRATSELVDVGAVTVEKRWAGERRLPNGIRLHRAPSRLFPTRGGDTAVPTLASGVSRG